MTALANSTSNLDHKGSKVCNPLPAAFTTLVRTVLSRCYMVYCDASQARHENKNRIKLALIYMPRIDH